MADLSTGDDLDLRHNAAERQYEAWSGGELAGRAEFGLTAGVIVFTHTEVGERFRGQGVASALIRYALDDVRAGGERSVVARCPAVKAWIERHEHYQDLLRSHAAAAGRAGHPVGEG